METTNPTFDPQAVQTTTVDITYHFKAFSTEKDSDGNYVKEPMARLAKLVDAGKLSMDDIEVRSDDSGEKWKRKSLTVKAEVPVLAIDGYTPEMNAHLQYLVIKQLEAKNKENIDECTGQWVQWHEVLQLPPVTKSAGGAKVTAELVEAVTDALVEYMTEAGYPAPAIELISEAGKKRFSANVCKGVPIDVLRKIDSIIKTWVSDLDDETTDAVEPVTTLWVNNIDKLVNPKTDVSADMFDL